MFPARAPHEQLGSAVGSAYSTDVAFSHPGNPALDLSAPQTPIRRSAAEGNVPRCFQWQKPIVVGAPPLQCLFSNCNI
jgi:hypothetical protein